MSLFKIIFLLEIARSFHVLIRNHRSRISSFLWPFLIYVKLFERENNDMQKFHLKNYFMLEVMEYQVNSIITHEQIIKEFFFSEIICKFVPTFWFSDINISSLKKFYLGNGEKIIILKFDKKLHWQCPTDLCEKCFYLFYIKMHLL